MKVFIITISLLLQSLHAVEIGKESISTDSYYIQVGAFKKLSNIQKVKDKLFEYEIYLESYKGFQRIHVVNILAPLEKVTLSQIRKIYPKAFISKRPAINRNSSDSVQKPSTNFSQSVKPSSLKLNNTQFFEQTLDSNTILKTRKSFL